MDTARTTPARITPAARILIAAIPEKGAIPAAYVRNRAGLPRTTKTLHTVFAHLNRLVDAGLVARDEYARFSRTDDGHAALMAARRN